VSSKFHASGLTTPSGRRDSCRGYPGDERTHWTTGQAV